MCVLKQHRTTQILCCSESLNILCPNFLYLHGKEGHVCILQFFHLFFTEVVIQVNMKGFNNDTLVIFGCILLRWSYTRLNSKRLVNRPLCVFPSLIQQDVCSRPFIPTLDVHVPALCSVSSVKHVCVDTLSVL